VSELSLALDIVLAVLLFAVIAYASVLNKKLATLRATKDEMENLVTRLVESTEHAQKGLADLKAAASESGGDLEKRVEQARKLSDDLGFLVDRAGGLAEDDVAGGRRGAAAPAQERGGHGFGQGSGGQGSGCQGSGCQGNRRRERDRQWRQTQQACG